MCVCVCVCVYTHTHTYICISSNYGGISVTLLFILMYLYMRLRSKLDGPEGSFVTLHVRRPGVTLLTNSQVQKKGKGKSQDTDIFLLDVSSYTNRTVE